VCLDTLGGTQLRKGGILNWTHWPCQATEGFVGKPGSRKGGTRKRRKMGLGMRRFSSAKTKRWDGMQSGSHVAGRRDFHVEQFRAKPSLGFRSFMT